MVVPAGEVSDRRLTVMWQFLALAGVLLVLFAFYNVATFAPAAR